MSHTLEIFCHFNGNTHCKYYYHSEHYYLPSLKWLLMLLINCWLISLNDIKQIYTASFVYKNYKNSICTKEILNYSEFLFVDGFHDVIKPADQQSHPLPQQTSNFLISHKTKWLVQQCHPLSVENHCKILKLLSSGVEQV